jgi:hypothetical protein
VATVDDAKPSQAKNKKKKQAVKIQKDWL